MKGFIEHENLSRAKTVLQSGFTVFDVLRHEQTEGVRRKKDLFVQIEDAMQLPQFLSPHKTPQKDKNIFHEKLIDFRLRMVGAISLYSFVTDIPYEKIVERGGIESFYLFWLLGASQDDAIDSLPKEKIESKGNIKNEFFGPGKEMQRSALFLMQKNIRDAQMGEKEKQYLRNKIAKWYRFVIDQERNVAATPFSDYTFAYSREYREQQNQIAGETLVSLLNWDKCLDISYQSFELLVPRFSFLTQIIDDIGDIGEDFKAERPSYAVGALVDNLEELERVKSFLSSSKSHDIDVRQLQALAPQAWKTVDGAFRYYEHTLQKDLDQQGVSGGGLLIIANLLYRYFPKLNGFIRSIDSKRSML